MPPKAQSTIARGRGRPRKDASTSDTKIATVPKKRGRPSKTQVAESVTANDIGVQRGRRASAVSSPALKRRVGRPTAKPAITAVSHRPATAKRVGRPPKAQSSIEKPDQTPKRLPSTRSTRVLGASRVTRRTPATQRIDPRVRSRLRARPASLVSSQPEPPVKKPGKRGRPAKARVQAPPLQSVKRKASAKPAKPVVPRKRRGITSLDVPDKFAAQVNAYLKSLVDEDAALANGEGGGVATEDSDVIVDDVDLRTDAVDGEGSTGINPDDLVEHLRDDVETEMPDHLENQRDIVDVMHADLLDDTLAELQEIDNLETVVTHVQVDDTGLIDDTHFITSETVAEEITTAAPSLDSKDLAKELLDNSSLLTPDDVGIDSTIPRTVLSAESFQTTMQAESADSVV